MASKSVLEDPKLLSTLVSQAKSSHSAMGRSIDNAMAHSKLGGGVEPSAISRNRLERERQLQLQCDYQEAWEAAAAHALHIPTLATMAPSFTKAADEGVEALGGTRMEGPGYTSVISLVPTTTSVQCIEDDFELLSSFRPYKHDALHAARQTELRHISSPHPDLLRQLEPTLAAVCPSHLVDMKALPEDLLGSGAAPAPSDQDVGVGDGANDAAVRRGPRGGTYPFVCQGRDPLRRHLPGVRQPCLGQYHVRLNEVESRVTGGYIQPPAAPAPVRAAHEEPRGSTQRTDSVLAASSVCATLYDIVSNIGGSVPEVNLQQLKPGENAKGSSMFLSEVERNLTRPTAAPDTSYWPYPDVRSTTARVKNGVTFDRPQNSRRREQPVSGIPTGAYDVRQDIANIPQRTVRMATTTSRDAHWFGKKKPLGVDSADCVDLHAALQATRPNVKVAFLQPRVDPKTPAAYGGLGMGSRLGTAGGDDEGHTVSIERDLNFPPPMIGTADSLRRVRQFGSMVGREQSRPNTNVTRNLDYSPEVHLTEERSRAASIHPRAPGHGSLHNPNPNEIGEVPNLKWVKRRTQHAAHFGASSVRPHHVLPFRDLVYHPEPGLRLIEPRVRGNPMLGSVVSRQHRDKVFATAGCGAQVLYGNVDIPSRVKSVPLFVKQITKETQFCGHRIQSERWERNNPKAPGPGYYTVNYSQVEV